MSLIVYKVIFNGFEEEEEGLALAFKELDSTESLSINQKYISALKSLSQSSQHIISFQNIREVIKIGENGIDIIINYYIVLLFVHKIDNNKMGFLIGNVKKKGDIILGIWPFTKELRDLIIEGIERILNNLISKPKDFSKICLIYS
ncbi:MAG: hypothetical protein ACFE8E_04940 [Candidatus Hodarchaeota archaeon]